MEALCLEWWCCVWGQGALPTRGPSEPCSLLLSEYTTAQCLSALGECFQPWSVGWSSRGNDAPYMLSWGQAERRGSCSSAWLLEGTMPWLLDFPRSLQASSVNICCTRLDGEAGLSMAQQLSGFSLRSCTRLKITENPKEVFFNVACIYWY